MGKLVLSEHYRTYNSNMKFLVLFACVAAASANLVTYPNGAVAPAKTPEVPAAEAAHFAAKGAYAYAPGFYGYNGLYNGYYNGYYPGVYGAYHHGGLVAYANGAVAPVDTPEVQAAKAAHFAAHGRRPRCPHCSRGLRCRIPLRC